MGVALDSYGVAGDACADVLSCSPELVLWFLVGAAVTYAVACVVAVLVAQVGRSGAVS